MDLRGPELCRPGAARQVADGAVRAQQEVQCGEAPYAPIGAARAATSMNA